MTELNDSFVLRHFKEKRSDQKKQKKLSHLILHNKNIFRLAESSFWNNISILYLQENEIEDLHSLKFCLNLTHLYLQKNRISRIDYLNELASLKVLNLNANYITVIGGLMNSTKLEELFVANQGKNPGDSLYLDPRTLYVLSKTLRRLDISGNQMLSINQLGCLKILEELNAAGNNVFDLQETSEIVSDMVSLASLDFRENEITNEYDYSLKIIASGKSIKCLDKKEVSDSHRIFYTNILRNRRTNAKRKNWPEANNLQFSTDISGISKNIPRMLCNSIIKSVRAEMKMKPCNLSYNLLEHSSIKKSSNREVTRDKSREAQKEAIWNFKKPAKN